MRKVGYEGDISRESLEHVLELFPSLRGYALDIAEWKESILQCTFYKTVKAILCDHSRSG